MNNFSNIATKATFNAWTTGMELVIDATDNLQYLLSANTDKLSFLTRDSSGNNKTVKQVYWGAGDKTALLSQQVDGPKTVTLSQSITNFNRLVIHFVQNTRQYMQVVPAAQHAGSLTCTMTNANDIYIYCMMYEFTSATQIKTTLMTITSITGASHAISHSSSTSSWSMKINGITGVR